MTFYVKAKKLDGTLERIEVSREIYRVYYESRRKEKYFLKDLKQETFKGTKDSAIFLPSKEDSYERLLDNHKQFADLTINIEAEIIHKEIVDKLLLAIKSLGTEEQELIHNLFYLGKTERELAVEYQLSQKGINKRKHKILLELKKLLNK